MPKINLTTKKRKKEKGIAQLKKDLWKLFALYVKKKASEDGEYVNCYTCNAVMKIGTSNCHAGHWLSKKGSSRHYFNEDNVRPQCYRCNINLGGNAPVFERRLKEEIGEEAVEAMYETRLVSIKRSRDWYLEKIEEYKQKLAALN